MSARLDSAFAFAFAALAAAAPAGCVCSGRNGMDSGGGGGGDSANGIDSSIPGVDSGTYMGTDAGSCTTTNVTAMEGLRPVDIVWIIDTSGSMDREVGLVQSNMNLWASMVSSLLMGIDYHVIVIADTGAITIPGPLGTDPTIFLAVNENVGSTESFNDFLATYPTWSSFLRAGAVRHIIEISDDDEDMSEATFRSMVSALTMPGFPATPTEPYGFIFHAIVAEDDPECNSFGIPCGCTDPGCPCMFESASRGDEPIALQSLTGGIFSSLCQTDWMPVFTALASAATANVMLPCFFDIPPPPMGMTLDYDAVNLRYTPSGGGVPGFVPHVDTMADCGPMGGWYYDDPLMPTQVIACPATCTVFMNDPAGAVELAFGCQTIIG